MRVVVVDNLHQEQRSQVQVEGILVRDNRDQVDQGILQVGET